MSRWTEGCLGTKLGGCSHLVDQLLVPENDGVCTGVRVGNNDVRPGVEKRKPCTKNQFNKPIRGVGTLTANAMSLNVTRPKGKSVSKNL